MKPCDVKPGLRVRHVDGDFGTVTPYGGSIWTHERDGHVWVRWDSIKTTLYTTVENIEPISPTSDKPLFTEEDCIKFLLSRGYMIKGPTC